MSNGSLKVFALLTIPFFYRGKQLSFQFILSLTVALFNALACVGWAMANISMVVEAQLINAVSVNILGYAGTLIIAYCTLVIVYFGYRVVHAYDVQ